MMTRKNLEAIAHVLDANHADLDLVSDFADMLAEENVLFDRQRFVTAATENLREDHMREFHRLDLATGRV